MLEEIRNCRECEQHLPFQPRPVVIASRTARILIIGQAPGIRVHESGIPWNDPSGNRLRQWLGLSREAFYDETKIALVPMGFCYPGSGPSGDFPPRPECAPLWHPRLREKMPQVKLTLLVGSYAQAYVLGKRTTVTKTVEAWKELRPSFIPMPHPSGRNNRWLKNNPWFEVEVLPYLRRRVRALVR